MPRTKHVGLVLAGIAVFVNILMLVVLLWHEKDHDNADYGWAIAMIVLVVVSIALTLLAVYVNLRDAKRAAALHSQIVTIKDEHKTQMKGVEKRCKREANDALSDLRAQLEREEQQRRGKLVEDLKNEFSQSFHQQEQRHVAEKSEAETVARNTLAEKQDEIRDLLIRHERELVDARTIVVHSATWGIGGMYSLDITNNLKVFVDRSIQQSIELRASEELFGEAGHPDESKVLFVKFSGPCSAKRYEHTFKDGELVDLDALCRGDVDVKVDDLKDIDDGIYHLIRNTYTNLPWQEKYALKRIWSRTSIPVPELILGLKNSGFHEPRMNIVRPLLSRGIIIEPNYNYSDVDNFMSNADSEIKIKSTEVKRVLAKLFTEAPLC